MKETDWKLSASKDLVRKLKPLRSCAAGGAGRVENFPPQDSWSWTLPARAVVRKALVPLGLFFLLRGTRLLHPISGRHACPPLRGAGAPFV